MSNSRVWSHILAAVFFSTLFFFLAQSPVLRADEGPGLGNIDYSSTEVCKSLFTFKSPQRTSSNGKPQGEGATAMHHGYLSVIFAPDSGGTAGGFSFWNVSNPRAPTVLRHYTPSNANSAINDVREPHGFAFSDSHGRSSPTDSNKGHFVVLQAQLGIQFWDWTDHLSPQLLNYMSLSGIGRNSDYADGVWWVAWQGRYAYVGGSGNGLYIVDAANPRSPRFVKNIPASTWGGARIGPVYAVGNLLVLSNNDSDPGRLVTFDISDPENPTSVKSISSPRSYSTLVNGNRVFAAGAQATPTLIEYTINADNSLSEVRRTNLADKGGYLSVQDGFVHMGASAAYQKIQISNGSIPCRLNKSPSSADWDFATALGNLAFIGNDHGEGSPLVVQQQARDTTGPSVNMVNPRDGATNQAVTSRVGITLTDAIDVGSISSSSFIVRPVGTTTALAGKYGTAFGVVNFSPDSALQPGTTYEVIVTAGGLKDYVGNGVPAQFRSTFTTAGTQTGVSCTLATPRAPATVGTSVSFSPATTTGSGLSYLWDFGDGATATTRDATHTYTAPSHYPVTLKVSNSANPTGSICNARQTIHNPLTTSQPSRSSTIVFDSPRNSVWVVNSDTNTVTKINNAVNPPVKTGEFAVGTNPQTIARAPDGRIWVTNQGSSSISILNGDTGAVAQTIPLPRGSRPFGVAFSPDNAAAYVTLQGRGELLKLNPTTGAQLGSVSVGPWARGIAVSAASDRVFVTRFVSPATMAGTNDVGEVREVSASSMTVTRTITLRHDPGPDSENNSRGVPNYLNSITISPDGLRAWVPSKKDNTSAGINRDGVDLTFETTVRAIVSQFSLSTNTEVESARIDINDRDTPTAVALSPLGDYAFVSTQGTNTVEVIDVYTNAIVGGVDAQNLNRRGPRGLLVTPNNNRLYLQNFISRTVSVFDAAPIFNGTSNNPGPISGGIVNTVSSETLPANVLAGKRVFYNAFDGRMNKDNYISCASCHQDGGQDGRVLDFTGRGEGFRNTVELNGRSGMGYGRVHWSGNFNEIQDFCNDIQGPFGGIGFGGTCNQPLGAANTGQSTDLDNMAAFVASLTAVGPSPFRNQDGTMTADAQAGQVLFGNLGCNVCHIPSSGFTDSVVNSDVRHNVGTIKPTSGGRLNKNPPIIGSEVAITGIDTPTLIGTWQSAPFLHDGSAPTLLDVLTTQNPSGLHGNTAGLSSTQLNQLVAYMQQLEDPAAPTQLIISNLSNKDTANPEWSIQPNLQNNIDAFGDRTYKWSNVGSFAGTQWIRTAADSKGFTGNPLVTFDINIPANVYVAIDDRVGRRSWMDTATWTDTGVNVTTLEGTTTRTQSVFVKRFPAGQVSLGPQASTTAANYSIFVRP